MKVGTMRAVTSKLHAVVARHHHERVVQLARILQRLQHPAQMLVEPLDLRAVVQSCIIHQPMRHIVCIALLLAPMAALSASAASKPARPTVFAAYYVWYPTGEHPQKPWLHWTYPAPETNALAKKVQRPGEPPPASAARPLAGCYDSADSVIARWHVQLAQAARAGEEDRIKCIPREWLTTPGMDAFGFYSQ